jgi:hypothetical protein
MESCHDSHKWNVLNCPDKCSTGICLRHPASCCNGVCMVGCYEVCGAPPAVPNSPSQVAMLPLPSAVAIGCSAAAAGDSIIVLAALTPCTEAGLAHILCCTFIPASIGKLRPSTARQERSMCSLHTDPGKGGYIACILFGVLHVCHYGTCRIY